MIVEMAQLYQLQQQLQKVGTALANLIETGGRWGDEYDVEFDRNDHSYYHTNAAGTTYPVGAIHLHLCNDGFAFMEIESYFPYQISYPDREPEVTFELTVIGRPTGVNECIATLNTIFRLYENETPRLVGAVFTDETGNEITARDLRNLLRWKSDGGYE